MSQTLLLRLAAFLLDGLVLSLLVILPASLLSYSVVWLGGSMRGIGLVWYGALALVLVGMLLRDGLKGRSPGKRLLGLQLKTRSGKGCGWFGSLVRNLPLFLPPLTLLEAGLVFTRSGRRLGDRMAGTTVEEE